jgi:regulator of sigma E protease
MNLGVFNLLPLPALDGGRIIFLGIEAVCRKPIKRELEQTINTVGLMILMALMLFVTMKDIFNLF